MPKTDLSQWRLAPSAAEWPDKWAIWLKDEYVKRGGGELSDKSLAACLQDLRHLSRWWTAEHGRALTPEQLTSDAIHAYFEAQAKSRARPSSRNRRLASLRVFAKFCIAQGFLKADPTIRQSRALQLRLPRRAKDPAEMAAVESVAVTGAHVKRSTSKFRWLAERDLIIWKIFTETALRISSVAALDVDAIDLPVKRFRVIEKGNMEIELPISDDLAAALVRWLEVRAVSGQSLVCDWSGNRLTTGQIRRRLYAMASKAGVALKPHDLRHTRIESVIRAAMGRDMPYEKALDVTMTLAGHRSARTTLAYLRASMDDLAAVNNAAGVRDSIGDDGKK